MKSKACLLDTHAWIWWVDGSRKLSKPAHAVIERAIEDKSVYISAISAWEVTLLVEKNRLELTLDVQDWIARTEDLPFVRMVPIDTTIAIRSVRLPSPFHPDPADRIIVATGLILGLPVISCDERILKYPHIQAIW